MTFIHENIIISIFSLSDFDPSKILSIKNKNINIIYQNKNINIYLQKKININTIYQKQSIINKTKISILFIKNKVLLKNKNIKSIAKK